MNPTMKNMTHAEHIVEQARSACAGEDAKTSAQGHHAASWWIRCLLLTFVGAGLYGAVIGLWRAPLQAAFAGIKLPLLLVLTAFGNALINGMFAQLLGATLRFRDSLRIVLSAMQVFALILGSLAPVALFVLLNTPATGSGDAALAHHFNKLLHTLIIAFAGITAHLRMYGMLVSATPDRSTARRILAAWLAVNLFLGAQISWNLRPFMAAPHLPVEFFRPNAFEGNFYETLLSSLAGLSG